MILIITVGSDHWDSGLPKSKLLQILKPDDMWIQLKTQLN